MKQTPSHNLFNAEVLQLMRPNLDCVVEVGTSVGNLAREYRQINPYGQYIGIEVDPEYAATASQYCSEMIIGNIEHFSDDFFSRLNNADCWIFADVLEHLYDPWELLKKIKQYTKPSTEIIACIPNAQHWSMQALLCSGMLQYQDEGLLDRTHIRFFTRQTMIELFESTGYKIINGIFRAFEQNKPSPEVLSAIKSMATAIGVDPELATNDAIPFQWVIRAVPA